MIYYAATFTVLAGLHTTPLRSLSSKMVDSTEFGKLFTCVGVAVAVAQLISNSILLEVYADTVESDPGFMYLLAAAFSSFALVITVGSRIVRKNFPKKNRTTYVKIALFGTK